MSSNHHWTIENVIEGGALQATITLATNGEEVLLVDSGYPRQEKQLLEALARRGYGADAVTLVANTHLHFDHSHNNSLFRKANILCARREYEWMTGLCERLALDSVTLEDIYKYYPELKSFENDPKPIWNMVKMVQRIWSRERLGRSEQFWWLEETTLPDGMRAIPTPGHVPFHFSFVFDTAEGSTLVAGDAMITRGDADQHVMTFPPAHRRQYNETKQCLAAFEGIILPGHDIQFDRRKENCLPASS